LVLPNNFPKDFIGFADQFNHTKFSGENLDYNGGFHDSAGTHRSRLKHHLRLHHAASDRQWRT